MAYFKATYYNGYCGCDIDMYFLADDIADVEFYMSEGLYDYAEDYFDENPDNERVNIPGSVNEFNWTYRLPVTIEKLIKNKELISEINNIVKIHER